MEEAQAKTNDIRDTIKAEILVRKVEGLTAGTYIIHWASVLSNHLILLASRRSMATSTKPFTAFLPNFLILPLDKISIFRYSDIAICKCIRTHNSKPGLQKEVIMIRKTIKVSDNNFRKFDDPLGNETPRKYIFYAKTCDVPEGIPMSTNPRDQKLNSTVANAITESLLSNDGQFHLKNRGIILSAKRVRYDNRLQEVTIDFEDESCHGNIDGGHTYKILLENKDKVLEQYVQFEVMTGVEAMIADLAEARNTSIAVDAKSMAELREKFDPIKEGLEGLPSLIEFPLSRIRSQKTPIPKGSENDRRARYRFYHLYVQHR